jgi:hypothetical protein
MKDIEWDNQIASLKASANSLTTATSSSNQVEEYKESLLNYYQMILDNYKNIYKIQGNIAGIEDEFVRDKKEYRKKHDKDLQDIDLRHRQFQILQYDNFIKQQTVHLLYVLIVFLVICSLVIGLNLFFGLNKTVLTGIITLLIGFYILYLIKTLVVDDININVYDQHELDFNKPTNAEIAKGKSYSNKIKELSGNSKCNNKQTVLGVKKDVDNKEEQRIIDEICTGDNLRNKDELSFCQ